MTTTIVWVLLTLHASGNVTASIWTHPTKVECERAAEPFKPERVACVRVEVPKK